MEYYVGYRVECHVDYNTEYVNYNTGYRIDLDLRYYTEL